MESTSTVSSVIPTPSKKSLYLKIAAGVFVGVVCLGVILYISLRGRSVDECNAHGKLVDGACKCDSGFTGAKCEKNTNPCSGHGELVGGVCKCETSYTGTKCEKGPENCSGHGEQNADGTCLCISMYTGVNCETLVCNGHGTAGGEGICECADGWYGTNCERCGGYGEGLNADGKCECIWGRYGENCEETICGEHGTIVDEFSGCICDKYWYGGICDFNCVNGTYNPDRSCTCNLGYSGEACDIKNPSSR